MTNAENQHCLAARDGRHRPQRRCHWRIRFHQRSLRDALRDWTYKRSARLQGITDLRQLWQEAVHDETPGVSADDVLGPFERKYQAIAEAASMK